MTNSDLLIIKLGGSVITDKQKPLTSNISIIEKNIRVLQKIKRKYKIILVHGGGSFGHYWSVIYDMHTKSMPYQEEGIVKVRESMINLNYILMEKLMLYNMYPYPIPPSNFLFNNNPCIEKIRDIQTIAEDTTLTPITYGDVIHTNKRNFSIISGDTLMSMLSINLKPKLVIFTTNVDGVYENDQDKNVINEIFVDRKNESFNLQEKTSNISGKVFDVTGGMKRKIDESLKIVKAGIPAFFINGFYPERIIDVLENRKFIGTSIQPIDHGTN